MEAFEASAWAHHEFGGSELGHRARQKRAVRVAAALVQSPAASIPRALGTAGQAKGAYRFLSSSHVTHPELLSGPIARTVERCHRASAVLVVQDTTALTFRAGSEVAGLGPIDDASKTRGLYVHTALALSAQTHEVLGVLAQQVWARNEQRHPQEESSTQRLKRRRESEWWWRTQMLVGEALRGEDAGEAEPSWMGRVIAVFDREGDIYEALEVLDQQGHSFVIRAEQNRRLAGDEPAYLFEVAARAPQRATQSVQVSAGPRRAARTATLVVQAQTVRLPPPKTRSRRRPTLDLNVVRVIEPNPPEGVEPLEWILLTREPIDTEADVLRVVEHYRARWTIEELHKGVKTGCGIEVRQLETREALENFLAFATTIAVQMLRVRDAARKAEPVPAAHVLTPAQHRVLRVLRPRIMANDTARDALRAIASLGGFLARKGDGNPGWQTLWRGFESLLAHEQGFLIAQAESG